MTITFERKVVSLESDDAGVVLSARYHLKGTHEDGTVFGWHPVYEFGPPSESFTPYEQLTEADILGWVSPEDWAAYEQHVALRIGDLQAQKKAKELPWEQPQPEPQPQPEEGASNEPTA